MWWATVLWCAHNYNLAAVAYKYCCRAWVCTIDYAFRVADITCELSELFVTSQVAGNGAGLGDITNDTLRWLHGKHGRLLHHGVHIYASQELAVVLKAPMGHNSPLQRLGQQCTSEPTCLLYVNSSFAIMRYSKWDGDTTIAIQNIAIWRITVQPYYGDILCTAASGST